MWPTQEGCVIIYQMVGCNALGGCVTLKNYLKYSSMQGILQVSQI
jgi:hypothetical protein